MKEFFTVSAYTALEWTEYYLWDSFILNSGTNIHICNNWKQLQNFQPATEDDMVYTRNIIILIKGFGDIVITA